MRQYLYFEMMISLLKRFESLWKIFLSKDWYPLSLYTLTYLIHCFVSWDHFKEINSQIESEMILQNGFVAFWQLYPYQIFSVYLVSIFFLLFSYLLVSFFSKLKIIQIQSQITSFYRTQFKLFYSIICLLYIGNIFLGAFSDTGIYMVLVLCFWLAAYLLFVNENGKLFRNKVLLETSPILVLSKSIGYMIPIVWSYFILLLIKR